MTLAIRRALDSDVRAVIANSLTLAGDLCLSFIRSQIKRHFGPIARLKMTQSARW